MYLLHVCMCVHMLHACVCCARRNSDKTVEILDTIGTYGRALEVHSWQCIVVAQSHAAGRPDMLTWCAACRSHLRAWRQAARAVYTFSSIHTNSSMVRLAVPHTLIRTLYMQT